MKSDSPLRISIVTPSLNQARFLGAALRSVQRQTYSAFEHLVFDGGSSDDSIDILTNAANQSGDTSFYWQSKPDGGQSAALNRGFLLATGDVIGWLNADDEYRPDCLMQVANLFSARPDLDVIYGDYTFMDENNQHLELRREIEFSKFILNYHRVLYIPTAATFFRRRVFDEGNLLREDLHYAMDLEFFIRLAQSGYKFKHLHQVLADFRVHPKSKSVTGHRQHRAEHRSVVLSSTPIARLIPNVRVRAWAATLLQLPAACMRYTEKLRRGYYLPEKNERHSLKSHFQLEEKP